MQKAEAATLEAVRQERQAAEAQAENERRAALSRP